MNIIVEEEWAGVGMGVWVERGRGRGPFDIDTIIVR